MTDASLQFADTGRRLDAVDRKILAVLQQDASLSVAEIGDRVGLSSTPCWKRIQRLEACVDPTPHGAASSAVTGQRTSTDRNSPRGFSIGIQRFRSRKSRRK